MSFRAAADIEGHSAATELGQLRRLIAEDSEITVGDGG